MVYDQKRPARVIPNNIEREVSDNNLNHSLNETYNWLKNNWTSYSEPIQKNQRFVKKVKVVNKIPIKKYKPLFWVLFSVLALPFITLLLSLLVSFISYKSFLWGKDSLAKGSFTVARAFAVVSEKESGLLKFIPGLGLVYKEVGFGAGLTQQSALIATHAIPVVRDGAIFLESVLGDKIYDPTEKSH